MTSDTETTLARIWEEVLGVPDVRAEDDFFDLGGDSLLVVTMVSRVRRAGMTVSVKDVNANSVLSDLARAIAS